MTVIAEKDCISPGRQDAGVAGVTRSMTCPAALDTKLTILLISLLSLLVLLVQFVMRDVDNNRLLSWQWVMNQQDLMLILLVSSIGFIALYKSCHVHIPQSREVLLLVAGSCAVAMATWGAPEFMVDTGRYFTHAKLFATHGIGYFLSEWGYGINAWTDMPLASVIYGAAFYVFGESRLPVQIVNTCLFSGSIYLTYRIGRELWDARTGLIAAWLLLAMPILHVQASQMLVDLPAMFFAMLALLLSIMAVKRTGHGIILLAAVAIVFALLTKYSVWIALTPIAVLPFTLPDRERSEIIKRLSLLGLVTTVLLVFIFYVHHPILLKQLRILLDYQLPAFERWQESYASTFFYQIHPFVSLAAVASVYFAIRKKQPVYLVPASALCVMFVLGVYRARYLIIVFPLLALLAALGFRQVKDVLVQRFTVRSAVMVSLAITLVANLSFLQTTSAINIKNAGDYLNGLDARNIVAVVLPQSGTAVNPEITVPILDYYTSKPLLQADNPLLVSSPSQSAAAVSSLRFTWEVDQYPYPVADLAKLSAEDAIVLVTGNTEPLLPVGLKNLLANYTSKTTFAVMDNVFRFQSIITIYHNEDSQPESTSWN
jgi:hypothetical protein